MKNVQPTILTGIALLAVLMPLGAFAYPSENSTDYDKDDGYADHMSGHCMDRYHQDKKGTGYYMHGHGMGYNHTDYMNEHGMGYNHTDYMNEHCMGHGYMKGHGMGYMLDDESCDNHGKWNKSVFDMFETAHSFATDDYYLPIHEGTITVTGSSQTMVVPDLLTIRLGVETMEDTASEALDENSRLLNAAVEAITALGISEDDLSTAYFNISPQYDFQYDDRGSYTSIFLGYEVVNTITVTTEMLNMTADIIDAAVEAGANKVDSVTFGVSPDVEAEMHQQLIGAAVDNAISRAEMTLEPLGYVIVGIDDIRLGSGNDIIEPLVRFSADIAFASAESTPVFAGDQRLTALVTITFIVVPE